MIDRLQLRGIRALGTHGVLPEEQGRAQPFEVDLDVELDMRAAGSSDSLGDTIDYGRLAEVARDVVAGETWALLERLAQRIADEVRTDSRVDAVTVTVRKLRPPVAVDVGSVGVCIRRP